MMVNFSFTSWWFRWWLRNIVTSMHTYTHMCTNSLMPLTQSSELCLYESKWLCTSRKNPVHIRKSLKDGDGVSLVHCTYTLLISLFSFMSEAATNLSFSLIIPFCQILWRRKFWNPLFLLALSKLFAAHWLFLAFLTHVILIKPEMSTSSSPTASVWGSCKREKSDS